MKLPRTVEELTAEWLTNALSGRCPGLTVTSLTTEKIIWGTATKVLVTAQYAGHTGDAPPHRLCIKGEFDARVREVLEIKMTGTQVEANFFNDIAPQLGVPLPRHWYGGSEPGMGILVLEDLYAQGFSFGTPTEAWSPEMVSEGLEILALLHGSTWGPRRLDAPWLQVGSAAVRGAHDFLLSESHWDKRFSDPNAFRLPAVLQNRERCLNALHVLCQHDDSVARCVIHGDAHLGNTCVDPHGKPFFIDWAGPCISSWAFDVSYFIAGSLTVSDRRARERDLLQHYLDRLASHGAPSLKWDEAWREYRLHHMPGLVWATLPASMQSLANVDAMSERFAAAIVDHDTVLALEERRV